MKTDQAAPQNNEVVKSIRPLGFPWQTSDPFLFCVYHNDAYPAGNEAMGPAASLKGRQMGDDFQGKDGWRMYHGEVVPGFPQHPHRGFETVTVVRKGLIDHSDSLGATARFGHGDVQWLTAGKGISHAEMFPLVKRDSPNPLELFQIWLNLPKAEKFADPYFSMQWDHQIPRLEALDEVGRKTEVTLVAGRLEDLKPVVPPPNSWASRPESDLAIWTLKMAPHAKWTLPSAQKSSNRTLYFFKGNSIRIGNGPVRAQQAIELQAGLEVPLENGEGEAELLLLQGRPIGEPVAQYGPFVMNTRAEIEQAFQDYQSTRFGGWPWKSDDPIHPREETRFARHADGRLERPK
ncbi:MAG TPA: pirin family protein [bacterium]|jgi:redox-sensitive bicupin YhaK (pirin superfamily)|nr:pirin family protein [bacterium]